MTRRNFVEMAAAGAIPWEQPRVDHRRWQLQVGGGLLIDGVVVGLWVQTLLPSPGRMRAGRFTVVQLVTSDCHLMIALEVQAPQRARSERTVACIELAGSKWFPLNGNATLVVGGDGSDELRVTLAEVL